jgi:hypothetical protein
VGGGGAGRGRSVRANDFDCSDERTREENRMQERLSRNVVLLVGWFGGSVRRERRRRDEGVCDSF